MAKMFHYRHYVTDGRTDGLRDLSVEILFYILCMSIIFGFAKFLKMLLTQKESFRNAFDM